MNDTNTRTVRLSVNLNAETATALRALADGHGITLTEALRRAIGIYKFVSDEVRAGNQVQTVERNGDRRSLGLL